MKMLKTAALALALGASGTSMAATDGTPGATSTGSFNASISVDAPETPQLQVVGLQDVGGRLLVTNSAGIPVLLSTQVYGNEQLVCFNGPANAPILITITQTNPVAGQTGFRLVGTADSNSDGILDSFPARVDVTQGLGFSNTFNTSPGVAIAGTATSNTCTAQNKTTTSTAYRIIVDPDFNFLNDPAYKLAGQDHSLTASLQVLIASQ